MRPAFSAPVRDVLAARMDARLSISTTERMRLAASGALSPWRMLCVMAAVILRLAHVSALLGFTDTCGMRSGCCWTMYETYRHRPACSPYRAS